MQLVRNHSHWGAFLAEVEGGRIVGVRPFENDPDPSHLINAIPDGGAFANRASRSRWCARAGSSMDPAPARAAAASRSCRCHGTRRSIWSRARLTRVRREHGPQSIMGGSQGWSSAGIFHEARVQLHRFLAAGGGFVDSVMNYSFGCALAFLPHILGRPQAVIGPLTSWSSIARHGKLHGAVRRRQSEEHAGQQGRLRVALHRGRGSPSWPAPASRSSTSARSASDGPGGGEARNGFRSGRTPTPRCCSR